MSGRVDEWTRRAVQMLSGIAARHEGGCTGRLMEVTDVEDEMVWLVERLDS